MRLVWFLAMLTACSTELVDFNPRDTDSGDTDTDTALPDTDAPSPGAWSYELVLSLDGSDHLHSVERAATVAVDSTFGLQSPYTCNDCRAQLVLALGDQGLECLYDGVPTFDGETGQKSFSFQAPNVDATYDFTLHLMHASDCAGALGAFSAGSSTDWVGELQVVGPEVAFIHVADADHQNTDGDGDVTVLDHPLLNGRPDAQPQVTVNWSQTSTYVRRPVGVIYDEATQRWQIRTTNGANLPANCAFNVLVPSGLSRGFVQATTAQNTVAGASRLPSHLDDRPSEALFATVDLAGSTATPVDAVGSWFSNGRWYLVSETSEVLVPGAHYFVLPYDRPNAFLHTTSSADTTGHVTYLDHPALNSNPGAVVLASQRYQGAVKNASEIGIWYSSSRGQWSVYNENLRAMAVGERFNIVYFVAPTP